MYKILDICFAEKERISLEEFMYITETKSSDMFLAMLSLFRERLPCSENYWRYKRNYEIHMQILNNQVAAPENGEGGAQQIEEESKNEPSVKKFLAPSHMSFVKPLSHYNEEDIQRKMSVGSGGEPYSPGYKVLKMVGSSDGSEDADMNEGTVKSDASMPQLDNIKSNRVK